MSEAGWPRQPSSPWLVPAVSRLVSVVVPVHDGARFLARCVESVSAQDHPDVEVVVVDDGSSDDSARIARRLGARVVRPPHDGLPFRSVREHQRARS